MPFALQDKYAVRSNALKLSFREMDPKDSGRRQGFLPHRQSLTRFPSARSKAVVEWTKV
jgi:hypothetical protein